MNQITIAFICPSRSWGGLEMNVFKLCQWLSDTNAPVLLYCYPDSPLHVQAQKYNLPVALIRSVSKMGDVFLAPKLAASFRKHGIETVVFHLNKNFPLITLTKLLLKNKLKSVYMQHMHLGGMKKDIYHDFLYKNLDIWISPLKMFSEVLQSRTNIPPEKIRVLPFGIELGRFTATTLSQQKARAQLSLPLDKKIVGFVGRFDPQKNQHLLIEAVGRHNINADILLVGDFSKNEEFGYEKTIETMIEKYQLSHKVHIRSHLDEIEPAYKAMDVFCLTSGSETFGMVTVEALASKVPVLASNSGGTVEIIRDRVNGLLYTSGDPDDLGDKLSMLLEDTELKRIISVQGQKDAIEKYSHLVQVNNLLDILQR